MEKYILLNQEFIAENKASIPINDRGFMFGDGIFERCRLINGKIYDFKAHYQRIKLGLKILKINADISNLEEDIYLLSAKNQEKNAIIKIDISRGCGNFGYLPNINEKPLILIRIISSKINYPKQIRIGISSIKNQESIFNKIKSKQSLPYILTKIKAQENNLFDGIILTKKGFICETSSANIFWVKNGEIYTPSKKCGILDGTVRNKIIKLSPIKINEVKAKLSEIKNADEIFLTNISFFVLSVDELIIKDWSKKFRKNFCYFFYDLIANYHNE